MPKLMHFTAGVAVGALAIMVLIKTPTVATDLSTRPQTISVEELQRSIDLSALPVQSRGKSVLNRWFSIRRCLISPASRAAHKRCPPGVFYGCTGTRVLSRS